MIPPLAIRLLVAGLVAVSLTAGATLLAQPESTRPALQRQAAHGSPAAPYGRLPLAFEANRGRVPGSADFLARGPGYTLALDGRGATLTMGTKRRQATVRTRLLGARAPEGTALRRLPGTVNSLIGNDRTRWRTGIPTYRQVRYSGVYPGIDLVYYGRQRELEYDFVVRPGADPGRIGLQVDGGRSVALTDGGAVSISTRAGNLLHKRPVAYQVVDGRRHRVAAEWRLDGRGLRFAVGDYDRTRPLVIDPILSYATFVAAAGTTLRTVTVDGSGNAYVAGNSTAASVAGSQANTNLGAGGSDDVFVAKLNPAGTAMLYATFVGGTDGEYAQDIAVDNSGAAYVVGQTNSTSTTTPANRFPTAGSGVDTSPSGSMDAFVFKLAPDGASLHFSTFLGGASNDIGYGIGYRRDAANNRDEIYATGSTPSSDFPTTTDTAAAQAAYDASINGDVDTFLTKYTWNGTTLTTRYSTYLGGGGTDASGISTVAQGVAVDPSGAVYLGGYTRSTSFPTTAGVIQTGDPDTSPNPPAGSQPADGEDGFVAKLNPALNGASSLVWSTYFGGTAGDRINAIAVTPAGTTYVAGETRSSNMPSEASSPAPFSDTNSGDVDAFVAQVADDGASFGTYTTYMGGAGVDRAYDVGVHQVTEASFPSDTTYTGAYVTGETNSGSPDPFPTVNGLQPTGGGGAYDAFVLKWTMGNIPRAAYSTYLGGTLGSDGGLGLAVGPTGKAYVVGRSGSDFPVVAGSFQTSPTSSAFAARVDASPPRILSGPSGPIATNSATFSYDTGATPQQGTNGFTCSLDGATPSSCGSISATKTYSSLADGAHTFDVALKDAAKAPSDPVRREFVVDTQPPSEFGLASPGPDEVVGTNRPTFAWQQASDAATSVASYRLVVDDREERSVDAAACSGGTCSTPPAADLVTGAHSWRIDAVDAVGNVRSSETRRFTVSTPPVPKLVINPNPALAGRTVTFDGGGSADATHTIAKYEWDLDGDGGFERDTGTTATTTQSYATAKTINVGLRVTDTQGSSATTTQFLRISEPGAAGTLLGVTINKGAQYTRTPDVTVSAVFPAGTTSMIISNDGGFLAGGTFGPQSETKWKLDSSGPERLPKTIYVRFFTGPFPSETFQDDIILDETPPVVQQAALAPASASTAEHKDGSGFRLYVRAAARKRSWKLRIRARDSNSGVARVQATANKRKPGKLLRYKRRLTVKAAAKPKWVRARDRAGNFSRWRKVR